jgi:hypothetical protein
MGVVSMVAESMGGECDGRFADAVWIDGTVTGRRDWVSEAVCFDGSRTGGEGGMLGRGGEAKAARTVGAGGKDS